MTREKLEFAICQYLDGELPPQERAALEAQLASDPAARQLLEEYTKLDQAMKQAWTMPAVNWDRLAEHLSDAVSQQEAQTAQQGLRYKGRIYSFARVAATAVAAACIIVAATLAIHLYNSEESPGTAPSRTVVAKVQGPQAEAPAGQPVAEVEIGPGNAAYSPMAQAVVQEPTRVVVASEAQSGQDSLSLFY